MYFSDPYCLKTLYFAIIRSIVKYSSVVWNPSQIGLTNKLDKWQRRFLQMISTKLGMADYPLNVIEKR